MTDKEIAATLKAIKEHGEFLRKQSKEYVAQYLKALFGEADFPAYPKPPSLEATIQSQQETIEKLKGIMAEIIQWDKDANWPDEEITIGDFVFTSIIKRAKTLLQSLDNPKEDI